MNQNTLLTNLQSDMYKGYMKVQNFALSSPKAALLIGAAVVSFTGLIPQEALADIPTATDDVVPDAVDTEGDVMTQGAQLAEIVVKIVAALLAILAVVIPLAAIIKSFRQRKQGDNDEFQGTVVGGLFVMVLGLGLGILAFNYAGGLAAQVMTVGGA